MSRNRGSTSKEDKEVEKGPNAQTVAERYLIRTMEFSVKYVKIGSTRSVYVFLMMRTYFLVKMEFTSWCCDNCNKGVAKLFQSVVKLQARQDKLKNRVDSVVEEVKGMREDLNRVENKISEMYELEKIKEVVDEQLQGVDSKLVSVNSAFCFCFC